MNRVQATKPRVRVFDTFDPLHCSPCCDFWEGKGKIEVGFGEVESESTLDSSKLNIDKGFTPFSYDVAFTPCKIRGRIFSKEEAMEHVRGGQLHFVWIQFFNGAQNIWVLAHFANQDKNVS